MDYRKQYKCFIIIFIFIASCNGTEYLCNIEVKEKSDYSFDDKEIIVNNEIEVLHYVYNRLKYIEDYKKKGEREYWQLPEESFNLRTGDCEDFTIFIIYLCVTKLGLNCELVRMINKKTGEGHIEPKIEGRMYFPFIEEYDIDYIASYNEVMWMTYNYHRGVGQYCGD